MYALISLAALALCSATVADDLVVADFEGPDYGAWTATGSAFGGGPARGTLPNQMPVTGYLGEGLVNSYLGGDGSTGALTSPPFPIERHYLNFLIGGGKYPGETCINLLVDGEIVRTATGPNDRPGGSERLAWHCWDVGEFIGREAVIEIIDQATGGWGHINVDHIVQSSTPARESEAAVEMVLEHQYLNFPVRTGAPVRQLRVEIEGGPVREFDIELSPDPEFWAFMDVSGFAGRRTTIRATMLESEAGVLSLISQDDAIRESGDLYRERLRPQFHFSSRRGWSNDPNGLVYYDGEYHLYYQHNPYGVSWGSMHWGHAVSPDLVHWTELPIALYPERYGDLCFSGSAVVDHANTAGFRTGDEAPIVAAFTSTARGECIRYSNDRGRTFTEYAGNPVVQHQGRDPKVIWYEPGSHWVMAVYDERGESQGIAFYSSPDLKAWRFESRIESYYECPEIFAMPVDGEATNLKWLVYAADGAYSIGTFDGTTFTAESGKHRLNYGNCFYASQTWNNIPPEDGRRIQIAWGTMAMPGMPFNQMMTFPVELKLRTTDEGLRLFAEPVREIELLRGERHAWEGMEISDGAVELSAAVGELLDSEAIFELRDAKAFGLDLRGVRVTYDAERQELSCAGCVAPLAPEGGKVRLRVLVDRTSVEVYANGGRVYMPVGIIVPEDNRAVGVFAAEGETRVLSLAVYELRSAWRR